MRMRYGRKDKMKKTEYAKKITVIIIGAIISAFGISIAINAGFGGATLAVLWQGTAKCLNMSIGTASAVVAAVMILFAFFYDRKQIHIGTVLYQIFYSGFVDIFSANYETASGVLNFFIMLGGILLFGAGTGMYAAANLGRGSYEAVTFAIAERNGFRTAYVRMALDAAVVLFGAAMGGSVGLCTVVTILVSGAVIQRSKQLTEKLIFGGM